MVEKNVLSQEEIDALLGTVAETAMEKYQELNAQIVAKKQSQHRSSLGQETENEEMELRLDVPVSVTVVIGRTKMTIRDLLQLNQGSIVALDSLAGDPLDILVNGTIVAHGEVVGGKGQLGVRLTDIVSKAERFKS